MTTSDRQPSTAAWPRLAVAAGGSQLAPWRSPDAGAAATARAPARARARATETAGVGRHRRRRLDGRRERDRLQARLRPTRRVKAGKVTHQRHQRRPATPQPRGRGPERRAGAGAELAPGESGTLTVDLSQAREVRVLLPGRQPQADGHGGRDHRQVAAAGSPCDTWLPARAGPAGSRSAPRSAVNESLGATERRRHPHPAARIRRDRRPHPEAGDRRAGAATGSR